MSEASAPSAPAVPRRPVVFILGALTAFGPMTIDMYLPSLPTLERHFAADTAAVQRTLALFLLGLAFGQAFYGPLADRLGRKGPLAVGIAIYVAASLGCALAPTIEALVALRVLQAIGCCAGMVIARAMVRDLFDPRESARVFSLLMLIMGVAPILAPLVGAQLLGAFGWQAIFLVLAAFGLACLLAVLLGLPESLPAERRVRGGLGSVFVTYARIARDRRFLGYALASGCAIAGMFAYIAGSPFVLIDLYGVPAEHYGWIFGSNAAGLILASQLNRRLLDRFAPARIIALIVPLYAGAAGLLALAAATGWGGLAGLLPPLFLCIASLGFIMPNTAAVALAPFGQVAGSASALIGVTHFVVGALSGAAVGLLHDGTAVPMAATILGCGLLSLAALHLIARPAGAAA